MRLVRCGALRVIVPPGVYAPRRDTAMLAAALGDVRGADVLELCAGSGAVALTAALRGAARVVAVDRSARAVLAVRVNARLNALRVDARRGDLLHALHADERFDVVVANPPYLPQAGPHARHDDRWDAGPDGRAVLDRIIDGVGACLAPDGRLVLVQSDLADVRETERRLTDRGLRVVRRTEHRGPLGPLGAARRTHLVRHGALDPEPDHTEEMLAVITARRTMPHRVSWAGSTAAGGREAAALL